MDMLPTSDEFAHFSTASPFIGETSSDYNVTDVMDNVTATVGVYLSRYDTLHPVPLCIHIISGLGIVGNMVTFIGIHAYIRASVDIILQSLMMIDSAFLIAYNVYLYSEESGGFKRTCACNGLDVAVTLLTTYTGRLSVGTVVYLSVDRYISTSRPILAPRVCTIGRARRTMGALALLLLLSCLEVWFRLYYIVDNPQLAAYRFVMFYYGDSILWFAIPFIVLLVFTSTLVRAIIKARRFCHQRTPCYDSTTGSMVAEDVVDSLVVAVGILFLFLATQGVSLPLQISWKLNKFLSREKYQVMKDASHIFLCLNSALNFPVLWVTGSDFRFHIRRMFGCKNRHVYDVSREEKEHELEMNAPSESEDD